jgi:hypothetical protein
VAPGRGRVKRMGWVKGMGILFVVIVVFMGFMGFVRK